MIVRCDDCGSMLAVNDDLTEYVEHHADGSHTHHFAAAFVADADRENGDGWSPEDYDGWQDAPDRETGSER